MIGIIAAIDEEIDFFIKNTEIIETSNDNNVIFYYLKKENRHIILAKSGAGKVNASMTVTKMIDKYKPEIIINRGIAGGLETVEVGNFVTGNKMVYYDVNMSSHRSNHQHGKVRGLPLEFTSDSKLVANFYNFCNENKITSLVGIIATGDYFVSNSTYLDNISREISNILAVDMESAAIAQVCYLHNVPFLSVRAISDIITTSYKNEEFTLNIKNACCKLAEQILGYICTI
ncbi:5'-methylthioadenosine/adenosylhomocysteine nucleosidase [Senegalia massiliensis]|uniref:5'-methylthioadenosine/adenosylhomocysteine nucleosidase n=1 Tax=Senegalia massiliensis TaxID=1720316 RepID=UPI0010318B43|nr:5'-methylthioadenosine/adenosylhomocysteine nucleosidase [Senegalia massiliensis]